MSASDEAVELITSALKEINRGNYFYAFNPSVEPEKEVYSKNMRLIRTIYDVLNDCNININSHGFSYIKDAVCIITDLKTLDVCLTKEVYPKIASKYNVKDSSLIEHDIRNSINSAFKASKNNCRGKTGMMKYYAKKPTNKTFLLDTVLKVGDMLCKEGMKD